MPFSWDQMIPGHQQTFKEKTIALYIDENRRLDGAGGVREYMKEHYNFDKSVSTYRREFVKWGIKKNDYPGTTNRSSQNSFDSGYGTGSNRTSSAATSLFERASSFRRQSEQSLLRLSFPNLFSQTTQPPPRPQSSQLLADIPETGVTGGSSNHEDSTNRYTGGIHTSDSYIADRISHTKGLTHPSLQEHLNYPHYQPPHAPPSHCSRAGTSSEFSDLGLETCQQCGATKLHHLASISRRTDVVLFKEVVRSNLDSINETDNEGNLCVHFAAGAGASLDQLAILKAANADVNRPNYCGQTILHLLDPQLYDCSIHAFVTFALQYGLSFSQRDNDGKTPLHHIFSRLVTLANVYDLLPLIDSAGRSMTLLDRNGNTPLDILGRNWEKVNQGVHLAELEAKLISYNIPPAFRQSPNSGTRSPAVLPSMSKLSITSHDEDTTDVLNIIKRSRHEPFCQNNSNQNVLHALAAFSFHANHQISCYMTPCRLWECLQHRLENITNVGVDVNQYSSDGFTPLHSFLTATFDISLDIPWLVPECVELLLQHGADPRLRDRDGNTALHLACSRGRFECAGKIISHLSNHYPKQQHNQCLVAINDNGKTVVEHTEASMNSETMEANQRRRNCIGLVRAFLGEPIVSYMPAAYSSMATFSSTLGSPATIWSAQLPNHRRKRSDSPARPTSGHRRILGWPSRTSSSLEEPQPEMRSAFDFED
ncbi:hypothetical protein EPUS_05713 [Endocarpon pusillum Z07020]|uniref:Clr5 domain-containing protein n=1 Tax=Endocarpon pusillum (strain Z07020 / HMAS-L-300199) TaxID=1263415 RepID=U1HTT7_ENDPU|nr:uncharacterized protein EPUS_05713 [Endocarpon pusillum Z07020]ERF72659.1 hypothetical protein EPUS_05713 [Endocarpon pusillum Z07020]